MNYIQKWKAEPSLFQPKNLNSLKEKLKTTSVFSSNNVKTLEALNQLYDDPWFNRLNLTNLTSQIGFKELNITNKKNLKLLKV